METRSMRRQKGSSIESLTPLAMANGSAHQGEKESTEKIDESGFTTAVGRRARGSPTKESLERVHPSIKELVEKSDEGLKKILVGGCKKAKCPSCKRMGFLLPQGMTPSTRIVRWKCGKSEGVKGCKHPCTQGGFCLNSR